MWRNVDKEYTHHYSPDGPWGRHCCSWDWATADKRSIPWALILGRLIETWTRFPKMQKDCNQLDSRILRTLNFKLYYYCDEQPRQSQRVSGDYPDLPMFSQFRILLQQCGFFLFLSSDFGTGWCPNPTNRSCICLFLSRLGFICFLILDICSNFLSTSTATPVACGLNECIK